MSNVGVAEIVSATPMFFMQNTFITTLHDYKNPISKFCSN